MPFADSPEREATPHVSAEICFWQNIGRTTAAILATSEGREEATAQFASHLLQPLVVLETLWRLAIPANAGNEVCSTRLVDLLRMLDRTINASAIKKQVEHDCCCCKPTDSAANAAGFQAETASDASPSGQVFREEALAKLLGTATTAAARHSSELDVERVVVALLAASAPIARLVNAHAIAGQNGVLETLQILSFTGQFPASLMMTSGSMPVGPDIPEFGIPGFPGGKLPPNIFDKGANDIIAKLLKPKWFDLVEIINASRPYPGLQPIEFHDPESLFPVLKCFREFNRLMGLLKEPPPPAPARAVWATGITSVSLSGACAGDLLTIEGYGFGAAQPANVALLLPTLDGCRATAPVSWSDNRIEAKLPARIASGPVGFGDATYIALYDAWAAKMRAIQDKIAQLSCGYRMDPIRPFGMCPPVTAVNMIDAGEAELIAFHANGVTALALEAGTPLELTWTVKNARDIRIERVSAFGPTFGGATFLVPAAGQTSVVLTNTHHVRLEEWIYRISTRGWCGGWRREQVRVSAVKRPGLRVSRMEVTQSIQRPDHSVPMVAGKPTVVRVLVENALGGWNGGSVPNVTGRLRMVRGGHYSPWIDAAPAGVAPMAATPGTTTTVVSVPSMNNTGDTINFILPHDWCWGDANYQVEVRVAGFASTASFAGFSDLALRWTSKITYQTRRSLHFRWIMVDWNGAGAPTAATCNETLLGAVPLLPTPFATVAPLPGQGIEVRNSGISADAIANERRDMLDDFDDQHNCSAFEAAFEFLGFDCPPDDGMIWVLIPGTFQRGEAAGTPSNVCYTPPNDSPYAAHELAHCLNQQHVRLGAPGNVPEGGVAGTEWETNGMLVDVPFDYRGMSTAATTTLPRALSLSAFNAGGLGVGDLMTYWGTPNGTWPSPRRWRQLWDYIGP